jgi:uncharacterized membrane protein
MTLLILGISVLLLIVGIILYYRFYRYKCGGVFYAMNYITGIVSVIMLTVVIVLFSGVVSGSGISEKIKLYQNENEEIENTIYTMVKEYMEYEKTTYKEFNKEQAMSYVSLYPDLKSNELVAKQVEIYTANKKKLNELKEQQIDQEIVKWWLYFG